MNRKIFAFVAGVILASPLALAEAGSEPPVPVRTVAPNYPEAMKTAGISGVVVLRVVIDEQGNVTQPEVEKSTNSGFNQAAIDAVSKWRFKPATRGGKPATAKVALPIKFSLES